MQQKSTLISGTIRPYFGGGASSHKAEAAKSRGALKRRVARQKSTTQQRQAPVSRSRPSVVPPPEPLPARETISLDGLTVDANAQSKEPATEDRSIPVAEVIQQDVDVRSMVASVAHAAGWPLSQDADLWQVTIAVANDRRQTVFVQPDVKDKSGSGNLLFKSIAGPAEDVNPVALLRYNAQVLHAAFAIEELGGQKMVVVRGNLLCKSANEAAIRHVIDTVASYADKVERRVTGGDQY